MPIDIVDVFRRTEDVMPIAEQAVAIGAQVSLAADRRQERGRGRARRRRPASTSVMDRCVKIEHARLFGGLHWAGVNTGVISARRPA